MDEGFQKYLKQFDSQEEAIAHYICPSCGAGHGNLSVHERYTRTRSTGLVIRESGEAYPDPYDWAFWDSPGTEEVYLYCENCGWEFNPITKEDRSDG